VPLTFAQQAHQTCQLNCLALIAAKHTAVHAAMYNLAPLLASRASQLMQFKTGNNSSCIVQHDITVLALAAQVAQLEHQQLHDSWHSTGKPAIAVTHTTSMPLINKKPCAGAGAATCHMQAPGHGTCSC
jgi:hypothetical protein